MEERQEALLAIFRKQAETCAAMNSPIYADLLLHCTEDLAAGGIVASLLADFSGHPILDNPPLRLLGAAHYLALRGDAPALAENFPSTGGRYGSARAWVALREVFERHAARIRVHLGEQVQTNEVRRCCALIGGFLEIARAFPWPLRVIERGASAGLNQIFEQYAYRLGAQRFGPVDARLTLACDWRGKPLAIADADLHIASRRGCDLSPIDLNDREQRLRLESFFWPDQVERLARLRIACECALRASVAIERAGAGDWIARELATLPTRTMTVLFHSVMWMYVPEAERKRIRALIDEAGARATADAPLAWLSMEGHSHEFCEIRLRTWPDKEDRLLGTCHYHGAWVEWL